MKALHRYSHLIAKITSTIVLSFSVIGVASSDNKVPTISQTNLYFLSPHADDISLTFGGLIQSAHGFKNKNIRYTTYFGTSNWTANELNLSTDKRVNTITHMRFKEDRDALTELFGGWKNYLYTSHGYHDAPLRDYVESLTAAGGPGGNFSTFRDAEKKTIYRIL